MKLRKEEKPPLVREIRNTNPDSFRSHLKERKPNTYILT